MSAVELRSREDAAERRRQSHGLEMGAHVALTRLRNKDVAQGGLRWVRKAVTTGSASCPARRCLVHET